MEHFLSSIIQTAAYLQRFGEDIPTEIREDIFKLVAEADSLLDDAASTINDWNAGVR